MPDNLKHSWDYGGQKNEFNDDYPGYAIFISNENADRAGSLRFGHLLGRELELRTLHYTPHYTLALMATTAASSSTRRPACTVTTS